MPVEKVYDPFRIGEKASREAIEEFVQTYGLRRVRTLCFYKGWTFVRIVRHELLTPGQALPPDAELDGWDGPTLMIEYEIE